MANLPLSSATKGASLLKKLLKKADDGDGVLTETEVRRATNSAARWNRSTPDTDTWSVDVTTQKALLAAVAKQKSAGDRSLSAIVSGVDEALKELKAADKDGTGSLSDAEMNRVRSNLAKNLLAFSKLHSRASPSSFKITPAKVYTPTTPFRAPRGATAPKLTEALLVHFNAYANDNAQGGARPASITRYVFGKDEAKGLAAEIAKLPATTGKAVLRELSKRVHMADQRANGFQPRRVYFEANARAGLDKLAAALGVKVNFKGVAKAPVFDYF